ncbi:hypothetical protein [Pseudosulfitobacter pseudonitzschiae]|uniref:hypothetical protein n=1 Tax=Pseudosulfitobacter pseudonitzschiae TaxID=1402135 RepID=UPI001AFC545B|nr:hypothetical protein [Pseudosulfitobacter pseudonitzschiae]MBM1814081.1 hypothetical protein [Pseudosulfitobacter pseudonitzschiae]MBM1831074.1 hypothetical protein [Pseudosulfitobacter pseudonitzschiae]MBM1835941.1 hypothetical protein [Pseudosulfitobacter pseudonitzschiae]MBM1840787.1 hypothetical protein [Pseudosulfitobacter pseudonitzschiae]MBM1845225.1 hypothetical protein [Pseudosulfitobacter pseudonitzschiae]
MTTQLTLDARTERLRDALDKALGVKGRTFSAALRKAGRRLPKHVRKQADVVVRAQAVDGHPKLRRTIDMAAVARAETDILAHLKTIDRADLRRGRLLGLAGVIVFNLIVVAALFVVWLVWSGHL